MANILVIVKCRICGIIQEVMVDQKVSVLEGLLFCNKCKTLNMSKRIIEKDYTNSIESNKDITIELDDKFSREEIIDKLVGCFASGKLIIAQPSSMQLFTMDHAGKNITIKFSLGITELEGYKNYPVSNVTCKINSIVIEEVKKKH